MPTKRWSPAHAEKMLQRDMKSFSLGLLFPAVDITNVDFWIYYESLHFLEADTRNARRALDNYTQNLNL